MPRINKFHAVDYTNLLGQRIKVGDPVVFVTHTIWRGNRAYPGVFEGVNIARNGSIASVRVGNVPVYKWSWDAKRNVETGEFRKSTLQNKLVFPKVIENV